MSILYSASGGKSLPSTRERNIDPAAWIERALTAAPVEHAPVTMEVAIATAAVKLAHRDPADRLLVATARVFDLTLVTADRQLIDSQDVPILAAR